MITFIREEELKEKTEVGSALEKIKNKVID